MMCIQSHVNIGLQVAVCTPSFFRTISDQHRLYAIHKHYVHTTKTHRNKQSTPNFNCNIIAKKCIVFHAARLSHRRCVLYRAYGYERIRPKGCCKKKVAYFLQNRIYFSNENVILRQTYVINSVQTYRAYRPITGRPTELRVQSQVTDIQYAPARNRPLSKELAVADLCVCLINKYSCMH